MRSHVLSIGAACILAFAVGCGSIAADDDDDIDAAPPECTGPSDCDDNVDCTDDTCVDNVCVFTPVDEVCDDGVGCTADVCDATTDCVFTPVDAACGDGVGCTADVCDPTADCTNDLIAACEECSTVLIYNDTPSNTSAVDAVNRFNMRPVLTTSEATFIAAFDAGGFEVVMVDSAGGAIPVGVRSRLDTWVTGGGLLTFNHWDLDANAPMQAILDVSVGVSLDPAPPVHSPAAGSPMDFFDFIETFPSPAVFADHAGDNGDTLNLVSTGFVAARFDDGIGGEGAILVTRGNRVIVMGFLVWDWFQSALNGDADGVLDGEELYVNELGFLCAPPVLFAADGTNGTAGNLYEVDPNTGATTVIGTIGFGVTAMSFDPTDGTLYGVTATGRSGVARDLITIDPTTGAGTAIGSVGTERISSMTFLSDGTLFGFSEFDTIFNDRVVTIDKTTGTVTPITASDIGFNSGGSGMAADRNDTVFMIPQGCTNGLFTMNTTTGASTSLGALTGICTKVNDATFLNGQMYGSDNAGSSGSGPVNLISIDTVGLTVTTIGGLPNGIDAIAARTP